MKNCEVIAIANQKGGVGKTTTTFSLGVALANMGKKVLLVSSNPFLTTRSAYALFKSCNKALTLNPFISDSSIATTGQKFKNLPIITSSLPELPLCEDNCTPSATIFIVLSGAKSNI